MENKKYPSNSHFANITTGFIYSYKEYKTLLLRDELRKELSDEHENSNFFLVIYAIYPRLTRITCYPIKEAKIWKLKLKLKDTNHEILTTITAIIGKGQTIHTTGLSEKNGEYVVENYLRVKDKWDYAKELVENLSRLKDIVECQIEELRESKP